MEREQALQQLQKLIGQDLRALAEYHKITVFRDDRGTSKKNKGWAGHVIERYLGLPLNSAQSPNFGSWELKVVPLKRLRDGQLAVKETMAITMIDPVEVVAKTFEESHLYNKLKKQIVVSRIHENQAEEVSILQSVTTFDLDNQILFSKVQADYELVRQTIQVQGFDALTGRMGELIQPRTKGPGHGSISRAFYARTQFVAHILGMKSILD